MRIHWISIVAVLWALPAVAAEVRSTETARIGVPVQPKGHHRVVGPVDPADLGGAQTPANVGDPVIEVEMDKDVYQLGERPTITVRVLRADKRGVENASVAIDDDLHSHKAAHHGNGTYTADLDGTPGEHVVSVNADAVIDGGSVHRAVSYVYEVATGHVRLDGIGPRRQDDTYLHVPLKLRVLASGWYQFQGTLVSKGTAVAFSKTTGSIAAGDNEGMELRFALVDLVEPGPYILSDVTVQEHGPSGQSFADALPSLGPPFAASVGPHVKPPPGATEAAQRDAEREARTRLLLGPGPLEEGPTAPQVP